MLDNKKYYATYDALEREHQIYLEKSKHNHSRYINKGHITDENSCMLKAEDSYKAKNMNFSNLEIKEFMFYIFFSFQYLIKTTFKEKKLLLKTSSIANMTIFQRQYYLHNCIENDSPENYTPKEIRLVDKVDQFGYIFNHMIKVTEFLLKHQKDSNSKGNTPTFAIPEETFYFFIYMVKFLTKYNLFPYLRKTISGEKFQVRSLQLINDALNNNMIMIYKLTKNKKMYYKIPGMDVLFEIVYLTILYHNDNQFLKIYQSKKISDIKFAYEYDQFNQVLTEAMKVFGNSIAVKYNCLYTETYFNLVEIEIFKIN